MEKVTIGDVLGSIDVLHRKIAEMEAIGLLWGREEPECILGNGLNMIIQDIADEMKRETENIYTTWRRCRGKED